MYIYIYTVNIQMDRESQGPKVHESRVATRCQGAVVPRLTRPAQWMDTVTQMLQDGCGEFYECGPLGHLRVHLLMRESG